MSDARPVAVDPPDRPDGLIAKLAPTVVLIVAAFVRFRDLGSRSLWTDEGSTWTAATLPFHALLRRCVERDASPPLYYVLTSWALKFGNDEAHLRLVSALASIGLVWLTYRIARLGLSRRASAFGALLCALSPFQVMYAQEARTYTLVALFLVGATYRYARFVDTGKRFEWIAYVMLSAAGLWTQSIAALGFAGQGAYAVLTGDGRKRFWPWIAGVLAAGALFVPWLLYGRGVADQLSSSHWYISDPNAMGIFKMLRAALLSPLPLVSAPPGSLHPGLEHWMPRSIAWAVVAVPPIAALTLSLVSFFESGSRGTTSRLAWLAWLVPVVAVFAVSLHRPLFLTRYFVFVTPFLSVLFAIGVSRLKPRAFRAFAGAWLVALALLGLARYSEDYTKEPWRDVAADIRAHAMPGHTAVLVPFDVDPMNFYLRDGKSGVHAFEVSHPDEPFAAHFTPKQLDELEAFARRDAGPYDDVWVVVRSPNSDVRREVARRAEAVASEGRTLVERMVWNSLTGPLRVARFERNDGGSQR